MFKWPQLGVNYTILSQLDPEVTGKVGVYETGVLGLEFGRSCPGVHSTWTNEGLGIWPWRV